jgi:hypothetical protein
VRLSGRDPTAEISARVRRTQRLRRRDLMRRLWSGAALRAALFDLKAGASLTTHDPHPSPVKTEITDRCCRGWLITRAKRLSRREEAPRLPCCYTCRCAGTI